MQKNSPLLTTSVDSKNKKIVFLKDIFMLLTSYDYFYAEFSLILSIYATSSSIVSNVKNGYEYIKYRNMSDHYQ